MAALPYRQSKCWPLPRHEMTTSVTFTVPCTYYVLAVCRHGLRRLAEEISVSLDLRTLRELQPLEELRYTHLRGM